MSNAQDTLDRVNRTARKLNALAEFNYLKAKRQFAEWRADDAEAENWRRDMMRKHADRCLAHQSRYDEAFEPFGKRAPQPEADAFPPDYRRKLFAIGQSMLPSDHELTQIGDPRDLDGGAIVRFEKQLFDALRKEAETPTGDNRADSVNDPKARREIVDPDTGRRTIQYFAKNSFIKDFVRPALRVLRLMDPVKGIVLHGPPFDRVPGR
jgi:hypothetical protein